jgi:hypothetical protein
MRRKLLAAGGGLLAVVLLIVLALVFVLPGAGHEEMAKGKFVSDPDAQASSTNTPGEGPAGGWDAYLAAAQAYPANTVPARFVKDAAATFNGIAKQDANGGDPKGLGHKWELFGPKQDAVQPGVTSFSGATNSTASRVTVIRVSPDCGAGGPGPEADQCTVWAGVSGGGIWRTNNALAPNPDWHQVTDNLAQNSVGTLTLDPTDPTHKTLYLGTGEPNRCSSGCEAGVGIYKSTDGGNHWTKLADDCVDNSTYSCVNHGDAFLGRAISNIVVDPTNPNHIFVGSALAVRGLSHVIGNGGTTRLEPGANPVGLYESTDGGATFTEVWNGNSSTSFGINDVGLDPSDPNVVYASAFDQGLWRRDSGAAATAFTQVFAPQFPGGGVDRTMFALTTKNAHTRIYLTEGTANGGTQPSNFWRTDLGDQSASTLLASQGACSPPPATTVGPQTYNGWQCLTSSSTASPYYETNDICTGQCWYDQDVYTPAGMPDTVYVIGSFEYGEIPCNTKGVGCGNGRSNGRAVVYSTTAGDPEAVTTADGTTTTRTFTDLTYDAQDRTAPWCGLGSAELAFGGVTAPFQCQWAPDAIHPDQHAIAINPNDPTQIFEGSDGGVIRTSGTFSDISQHCNSGERPLLGAASLNNCKRLLSRVPTVLDHVDRNLSSTLQFINVAIDPFNSNTILGGTQDNGTWSNLPGTDRNTFNQVIYGDGGNAAFDGSNPGWLANEFTGGFGDSNFENGDPTKWVIGTGPMAASGETFAFYWPQIGDPNPVTYNGQVTHPIYNGGNHVWRSWAFDAGTHGAVPQDTTPNIADYEANCPEFTHSGADPNCGDEMPLGGPVVHNGDGSINHNVPGDLTGTFYGSDRTGGSISWLARDSGDHGTLWAATSAGRIFVSHNVDATDPNDVTWLRIDNSVTGGSPTRFPSGITIDPSNSDHAWISYSGYDAVTPTTPGHVFSVTNTGTSGAGTFTNLDVEAGTSAFPTPTNDGDLPVADIVRDDATHTLYVATDFGVLRGDNDGTGGWHVTAGMPRYEVMHLAIEPSSRDATCSGGTKCDHVLYAATHSQGIWRMDLGPVK